MPEELTWIHVQAPVALDLGLRRVAAEKRVSRSEVVRRAVTEYLAKESAKPANVEQAASPTVQVGQAA